MKRSRLLALAACLCLCASMPVSSYAEGGRDDPEANRVPLKEEQLYDSDGNPAGVVRYFTEESLQIKIIPMTREEAAEKLASRPKRPAAPVDCLNDPV